MLPLPFYQPSIDSHQTHYDNLTVFDKVKPEMRELVDIHWAQFPPLNPLYHQLLMAFVICVGSMSVTGNLVVISIFTSNKALRTPSNFLVVNLAFSDFLMMFMMAPPMAVNCWNETWIFGPLACNLYAAAGSLFGCVSIWTMTCIAYDRYNVIVKGMSGKKLTKTRACIWILLVWLFCIIWTVAPILGWGRYVPEGNMTACGTDYFSKDWSNFSYLLAYTFFVYVLPLFFIIYSYYYILKAVTDHEKSMREQAKKMNVASLRSAENESKSAECKLAKVALVTISLWFVAWTPYTVVNIGQIFDLINVSPLMSICGSVFAKSNAVYNPIVYAISHPRYRAALNEKFGCGAKPVKNDDKSEPENVSSVVET